MAKSKIEISLPIIVGASDYHEFDSMQDLLGQFSAAKIQYEEIETDPEIDYSPDVAMSTQCYYFAIFYTGKKDRHIEKLIRDFQGSD